MAYRSTEVIDEILRDLSCWFWGVFAESFLVATWQLYLAGKALNWL